MSDLDLAKLKEALGRADGQWKGEELLRLVDLVEEKCSAEKALPRSWRACLAATEKSNAASIKLAEAFDTERKSLATRLEDATQDCDGEFESWRKTNSELRDARTRLEKQEKLIKALLVGMKAQMDERMVSFSKADFAREALALHADYRKEYPDGA